MYVCCWSVQVLGGSIFCPGLFFQERKLKRLGSWLAIEQPCKTEKEFCTARVHGMYMQWPCLLAKQICIIDVTSFMLLIEWFTVECGYRCFSLMYIEGDYNLNVYIKKTSYWRGTLILTNQTICLNMLNQKHYSNS